MKNINLDGKGKSKGFGFVNFTEHEHALTALRSINNNPEVFTPNHRPIVEFSMENRLALRAKEKRVQRSKEKNPAEQKRKQTMKKTDSDNNSDDDNSDPDENAEIKNVKKGRKKDKKNQPVVRKDKDAGNSIESDGKDVPNYAGLQGKKGVQNIPSFKAKGKKLTRNSLKQKRSKKNKKLQERKKREPQIKSKRPLEKIDKTERMIAKHKKKLQASDGGVKKKKWFE